MADREVALRKLTPGDMFHGRSPNGAKLICLVTEVTDTTIRARRITTQDDREFDRLTGVSVDDVGSEIDCVTPFPPDIHEIFLAMDRKGQELAQMHRNGVKPPMERYRHSREDRRAFDLLDAHVAANPI